MVPKHELVQTGSVYNQSMLARLDKALNCDVAVDFSQLNVCDLRYRVRAQYLIVGEVVVYNTRGVFRLC